MNIKPFLPFYHRLPNRFLYYYTRPFHDLLNNTAELTIAVYSAKDKSRQQGEPEVSQATAVVKWTKNTIYNI